MLDFLWAMPPETFAAFLAGALVVNFAPGADMVFAMACGMAGGPRVGALAGLGAGNGVFFHVTLAALGLSAVMAAHPGALMAIRWVGAGYLLYLAWKSWHSGAIGEGRGVTSGWRAWIRGVLSNVLNPKPALFMLAFLPQFVAPAAGPVWQQIVVLGTIFAIGGTIATMAYGALAGYAGHAFGARMGFLNRLASVMFVGLAAKLALD